MADFSKSWFDNQTGWIILNLNTVMTPIMNTVNLAMKLVSVNQCLFLVTYTTNNWNSRSNKDFGQFRRIRDIMNVTSETFNLTLGLFRPHTGIRYTVRDHWYHAWYCNETPLNEIWTRSSGTTSNYTYPKSDHQKSIQRLVKRQVGPNG